MRRAFCHVTLHLWGCVFRMFPDLRGLAFVDDGNLIGRISQDLKLISTVKSVFKLDDNLDFNLGKTMFLDKSTTVRHVFQRAQFFLENDPSLQGITHDFTFNIWVTGTKMGDAGVFRTPCADFSRPVE
jgi:hypothetical protein